MTLAKINHPNVVDILDFDEDDGHLFYVMAYHADNLGQLIGETYMPDAPSRLIPIEKALNYTRQILYGLDCLHYFEIIHRDVKPFNILITQTETLKLCDFGLSKLRKETFKRPSNLNVGSPFYAAPEQEKDPDNVDFSADLYSVGVILYRMLTGNLPFINDQYIPVSNLNRDLNDIWDDYFTKALSPHSGRRYQSAQQMINALDELAETWQKQKERICTITQIPSTPFSPPTNVTTPRQYSIKVSRKKAKRTFALDELWRPKHYSSNQFTSLGDDLIEDRTTGLIWQRSGSPYPLNWHQAHAYIDQLNQNKFAQKENWCLPTIAQLSTLLTELPHGIGLCIRPIFDPHQKRLWSNDMCSYTAAWLVHLELGFITSQDVTAQYYVRAVCIKPFNPLPERSIYPLIL
jgi:serine/threonine-protein kinase